MKKKYIIPNINVVKIQTQQVIAASATVEFGSGTKAGNEACSRRVDSGWSDYEN
ncbi:MAG: hypothetical protein IJP70_10025 [Bacteroidales bacterium]|nr:hypothetical protein [Bacteroidales bacterium]